jgi:hypothetical protein
MVGAGVGAGPDAQDISLLKLHPEPEAQFPSSSATVQSLAPTDSQMSSASQKVAALSHFPPMPEKDHTLHLLFLIQPSFFVSEQQRTAFSDDPATSSVCVPPHFVIQDLALHPHEVIAVSGDSQLVGAGVGAEEPLESVGAGIN